MSWTNEEIKDHINKVLSIEGSKILFGGNELTNHDIPSCYGAFEPTVIFVPLDKIAENRKLVTKELFGPFSIVTEWKHSEDLNKVLLECEKMSEHLTAAVVSNDSNFIQ